MRRTRTERLLSVAALMAVVVGLLAVASYLAPTAAQGLYQHVLLRVGTPASPVELKHYTGAIDTFGDHPNRVHCVVTVSTATTIQAVGGSCIAPGAGLSLYITDVMFSASAAGIGADAFPTIKSGTGGTCGAATAVVWQALTAAAIVAIDNRTQPIKVTANNELCWISSTAGSKALQISGFIAP
jgi:hypothetical protein